LGTAEQRGSNRRLGTCYYFPGISTLHNLKSLKLALGFTLPGNEEAHWKVDASHSPYSGQVRMIVKTHMQYFYILCPREVGENPNETRVKP